MLVGTLALGIFQAVSVTAQELPPQARNLPPQVQEQIRAALKKQALQQEKGRSKPAPQQPLVLSPAPVNYVEAPKNSTSNATGLLPFGLAIFRRVPSTFAPVNYGPVDPNYRLGPGDELVINAWGEVEFNYRRTVDRSGTVSLPIAGQVMVGGLTVDQAQARLLAVLARYHESLRTVGGRQRSQFSVSLGKLRPITVFVLGEVMRPGAYTLGAAATIFHALYAAGGPTPRGSLRTIVRVGAFGGRDTLDAYEYLTLGKSERDVRLRHMDVVFVPVARRIIEIRGAVRRPSLYELLPDESSSELIAYAGGYRGDAAPEFSQIERVDGTVRRLVDVSLAPGSSVELHDADIVMVGSAQNTVDSTVSVRGRVRYPRDYGWQPGMTVGDVVRRAGGPLPDAYLKKAQVVRLLPDRTTEVYTVPLGAILDGDNSADLELAPYDTVIVRSKREFLTPETVTIHGAVRAPGAYPYRQNMRLFDMVFTAGGLEPSAYTREAVIVRRALTPGQTLTDTLRVVLSTSLSNDNGKRWPDIPLAADDQVFIRQRPDWTHNRLVGVTGEVKFPGAYQLTDRRERVLDVIGRAGGFTTAAYLPGVTVERRGIGKIAIDLKRAQVNPGDAADLILQNGDRIVVPPVPQTVTIRGAVGLETSVVFEPSRRVDYYLQLAGGTLDSADVGRVRLVLYGGRVEKARKWFRWSVVSPGSTIIVPTKKLRPPTDWGATVRDAVAFVGSLAMTALLIIQVMNH